MTGKPDLSTEKAELVSSPILEWLRAVEPDN